MNNLGPIVPLSRTRFVGHGGTRFRGWLAHFDWPLFIGIALVALIGLVNLYSAVHDTAHSAKFAQQMKFMVLGLGCFALVSSLDYHTMHRLSWLALGAVALALLAVYVVGATSKGASRWLGVGAVRIQPSELAKLGVILALARLMHDRANGDLRLKWAAVVCGAIGMPIALVVVQPDLGTGSLMILIVLSVSLMIGRSLAPVAFVMLGLAVCAYFLFDHMHAYQQQRIIAFLDPSADPTGAGWNAKQSILAVGSGQLVGKGYLAATQNSFNFLPEYWTDFPFSVWAEEWGFLGAVFLIGVYTFVIFRCVHIGLTARDRFGAAICVGVAAMVFWHMTVNMCMVLGLAPVVGVTLPLISYGGSSVLTFWLGFGLVASVARGR